MNLWKALALIMISLLALSVGFRFAFMEGHSFPIDEKEKIFAINAAKNGLKDEILSNDYNITIQDHGWIISTLNGDKKVVHVIFTRENITLTALIDMDTGNIVEKSRIETGDWMTEYLGSTNRNSKSWGYQRLFRR